MKTQNGCVRGGVLSVGLLFVTSLVYGQSPQANTSAVQENPVPARITQAVDETNRVVLRGNTHPLARAEFDRGAVGDSQPMNRMLLLLQRSPEQEAALRQLLDEQQDKSSLNFHKWLTPAEFGKRFGPADADIQTITEWLSSQGFQGIKVGNGRTAIEFSGNVAQVRKAFRTEVHSFAVQGATRQGNASDPEIPAALRPVVAGIVSLHNFPRKSYRHTRGAFTRDAEGRILPQFTSSSGSFFAVGPADFAKIYNVPAGLTGQGGTIAIVASSNINLQDVADFQSLFGLAPNPPTVTLNGPDPDLNGEEGEADLDVQWSGAVAPGAAINVVVSEDTLTALGTDLSSFYIIDNNAADVMSLSFGDCESDLGTTGNAFFSTLWEQAASQGITVTVSAGDNGSAGCDDFNSAQTAGGGLAINGIASTPFNVAVGGTDFDDVGTQSNFWNATNGTGQESAKGYIPETTWNDSCAAGATSSNLNTICVNAAAKLQDIVAGSGGPSAVYPKPSWQIGTPADSHRDIPDVSLFASDGGGSAATPPSSESFYVVCQADAITAGSPPSCAPDANQKFSFLATGGTSASSPSFAGIIALIGQSEATAGRSRRQGNANYVLYKIAATNPPNCSSSTQPLSGSACAFYDVTKGNISVPCAGNATNCSSKTASTNGVLVDPAHTTTPAWTTGAGYDYATGLGTVNVGNLAAAWPNAVGSLKGTTTNLTLNGGTAQVTITHGSSVTAAVIVTSTTGTPTGDVSLLAPTAVDGGFPNGTPANTLAAGTTTINTSSLPGGTYNLTAHYAGDGTFAPSDSNGVPVLVNKEASRLQMGIVTFSTTTGAITSTNATTFAYGSPYVLRFDILNSSGAACQPLVQNGTLAGCAFDATGSVALTDNGSALDAGTFPINSAGHSEDQPIQLNAGTHNISAIYGGDISYAAPGSATVQTWTVTKATTATTVVSSALSIVSGGTVTFTATVSSNSNSTAGPSGTVQFMNGATALGTAVTCTPAGASANAGASCTATLATTLSTLPPSYVPTRTPRIRFMPLWIAGWLLFLTFLLAPRYLPKSQRRAYVYAGLLFFAALAAGLAGCGGGGGGGGSSTRTASITAVYSGDTNYAGSTSTAATVTIQ